MSVPIDIFYWRVEVDGEEWIVDGKDVKEVIRKVLTEEPLAEIDVIQKTDISKVVF